MLNNTSNPADQSLNKGNLDINNPMNDVKFLVNQYMTRSFMNNGIMAPAGVALLRECYARAAGEAADSHVLETLSHAQFNKEYLSEDELAFLSQHLNEVFQHIVAGYDVKYTPSLGFIQPQEVTDFMCEIASFPKDVTVYNPFAGADSFAVALPNTIEGEEINYETWALGQIRLFAMGVTQRTDIKLADSFEAMADEKKFKAIISSPAYLMENGKRIEDVVSLLYEKLEDGGTLVCLVSDGFLTNRAGNAYNIRKRLIEDKALKAVINIPNNIFTWSNVRQTALVLTKGVANEYVIMADASDYTRFAKSVYRQTTFDWEQFMRDMEDDVEDYWERGSYVDGDSIAVPLPYGQIREYDLFPAKYLVPQPRNGVKLSDIASVVPELRGKDATADYFITGSSIPAAMHRKPFVPSNTSSDKIATAKNHIQVPGDAVIIAIVSGEIRTVYTEAFNGKIAFPGGFIKVLKPIEGLSAKYLAAALSIDLVVDQIKAQTAGTIIPRLNRLDISQIIVPMPDSSEEREKLVADVISSEMSELESELQKEFDNRKREVGSTRHAMIQTLSALSSNWEQLRMFVDLKGGKIDVSDIIGRINPISVEKLLKSIGHSISTLERQVEALRFEPSDWGEDEAINPYAFINEYISTHATPSVRMVNKGKDNIADFPYFEDDSNEVKYEHTEAAEVFYAPSKLLERFFDNIVENAKAHGFTKDRQDNEIRFDWMSEDGNIVITIANNGVPLKDGVSGDDVLMSGFSTALNEDRGDGKLHSGQGGFEIKSLMEGLGSVEVISAPDSDFPVIYKLTFEKTNFETIDLED